jgi:hypothetical protein
MVEQSPSNTGHVVLLPAATPHRTLRLVTDVDLLLAATIASVRMNQCQLVFEPAAVARPVRAVPGGLRGGQESHRGRRGAAGVDGEGDEPSMWMSTRGILAWVALALGLPTATDYGLIPYIVAEVGVLALIVWAFRLLGHL